MEVSVSSVVVSPKKKNCSCKCHSKGRPMSETTILPPPGSDGGGGPGKKMAKMKKKKRRKRRSRKSSKPSWLLPLSKLKKRSKRRRKSKKSRSGKGARRSKYGKSKRSKSRKGKRGKSRKVKSRKAKSRRAKSARSAFAGFKKLGGKYKGVAQMVGAGVLFSKLPTGGKRKKKRGRSGFKKKSRSKKRSGSRMKSVFGKKTRFGKKKSRFGKRKSRKSAKKSKRGKKRKFGKSKKFGGKSRMFGGKSQMKSKFGGFNKAKRMKSKTLVGKKPRSGLDDNACVIVNQKSLHKLKQFINSFEQSLSQMGVSGKNGRKRRGARSRQPSLSQIGSSPEVADPSANQPPGVDSTAQASVIQGQSNDMIPGQAPA